MVDGSIYKVVAEKGGGFTKVNTAATATAAAVAVVATPATSAALPPSSSPYFSRSLYHLMCGLL